MYRGGNRGGRNMEAAATQPVDSLGNALESTGPVTIATTKMPHPSIKIRIKMPSADSTPPPSSSTLNAMEGSCCGSISDVEQSSETELGLTGLTDAEEKSNGAGFMLCTTNCNGATWEDYEGYEATDFEPVTFSTKDLSTGSLQGRWSEDSPATNMVCENGLSEQPERRTEHMEIQDSDIATTSAAELRNNLSGSWKKNRSARKDGGARRWESASSEVLQPSSERVSSRDFTARMLVWGKVNDRPWWPAEVVKFEELPADIMKHKRTDSIPVKFFGIRESGNNQAFALLEEGNALSYAEHVAEFGEQGIVGTGDGALSDATVAIAQEFHNRQVAEGTTVSSLHLKKTTGVDSCGDLKQVYKRPGVGERAKSKVREEVEYGDAKSLQQKDLIVTHKRKRESRENAAKKGSSCIPSSSTRTFVEAQVQSPSKRKRVPADHHERNSIKDARGKIDVSHGNVLQQKTTGDDGYFFECVVCDIGGNLLCCDTCPRTYHLECLNPPLKRTPPGKWQCPACRELPATAKDSGHITAESRRSRGTRHSEDTHSVPGVEKDSSKHPRRCDKTDKSVPQLEVPQKRPETRSKRECRRSKGEENGVARQHCTNNEESGAVKVQSTLVCSSCGVDIDTSKSSMKHSSMCRECKGGVRKADHSRQKKELKKTGISRKSMSSSQQEKESSSNCALCGGGGVIICCQICCKHLHKDCAVPHPKKMTDEPWTCVNCEADNRKQKEELPPTITVIASSEVDRILGCRPGFGVVSPPEASKNNKLSVLGLTVLKTSQEKLQMSMEEKESESKLTRGLVPANVPIERIVGKTPIEWNLKHESSLQQEPIKVFRKKRKKFSLEGSGDICEHEEVPYFCEASISREVTDGEANHGALGVETGKTVPQEVSQIVEEEKGTPNLDRANIIPSLVQDSKPEVEYLVKWIGRAHIHNDWVCETKLRMLAKRKLDNYKFKHGTVSRILVEEKWSQPQRVIGRRTGEGGKEEVLVKWCSLPYDECTWELLDEPVILKNQELIRSFDIFEAAAMDSEKSIACASISDSRSGDIETLTEQPSELKGGSLFPHQLEALNWLRKSWHRRRNVILADEMGLGKTISACAFISSLHHEFKVRAPALVLVPLSTMPNWFAEFSAWAPSLNVIEYHGSAKARAAIRQHEWHAASSSSISKFSRVLKFNVMLTTYEMIIADSSQLRAVPWELLIVDEGHRLKNSGSKLFHLLNTFSFGHRVLLTGTPLQNNVGEMYNLLNFLQPVTFPSLTAFEEKFRALSTAEQVEELKKLVAPHMLRRLKKDAMQNIPPKTERVVPVELSSLQAEYYRALLTRNYQVLRQAGKTVQHQSLLNIVMQLRKVCNHPYLIPGTEPDSGSVEFLHEMRIKASAKLTLLHAMLRNLKEQNHRVLIFSQMTKLLDILEDYLTVEFGSQSYERVDGSISVAERQAAITRFNQDMSRFVFLLSTRACGLGINLATADTVVIYDSDFNPHADIQAMNRAHRIGQSKRLLVYRLVVRASVEERILQLAKKKLMLDHLFANKSGSQKEVEDILRWGTEELFQDCPGQADCSDIAPRIDSSSVLEGLDDADGKQRRRVGGLGDVYEDTCHKVGRLKISWDEAAVARLLDRSELSAEVGDGEAESDMLGSLKAWDWTEQDAIEDQETSDCVVKDKLLGSPMELKITGPAPENEEENDWDKLLRSRWVKLQSEEEGALGRGKRMRKTVSYRENFGANATEASNESGNDDEEDHEPEYTPAGRALKNKLAKLRARQKERIAQRPKEPEGVIEAVDRVTFSESKQIVEKYVGELYGPNQCWSQKSLSMPMPTVAESDFATSGLLSNTPSKVLGDALNSIGLFGKVSPPHIETQHVSPYSSRDPATDQHLKRSISFLSQVLPDKERHSQIPFQISKLLGPSGGDQVFTGAQVGSALLVRDLNQHAQSQCNFSHGTVPSDFMLPVLNHQETFFNGDQSSPGEGWKQFFAALPQSIGKFPPSGTSHSSQSGFSRECYSYSLNNPPLDIGLRSIPQRSDTPATTDRSTTDHNQLHIAAGVTRESCRLPAYQQQLPIIEGSESVVPPVWAPTTLNQVILPVSMLQGTDGNSLHAHEGRQPNKVQLPLLSVGERLPSSSMQHTSLHSHTSSLSMSLGLGVSCATSCDALELGSDTNTKLKVDIPCKQSLATSQAPERAKDLHVGTSGITDASTVLNQIGSISVKQTDENQVNSCQSLPFLNGMGSAIGMLEGTVPWTEEELDALWAGVRRHGRGNWAAMLQDPRLHFSKFRTVKDLARRWNDEQLRMFGPDWFDNSVKRESNAPIFGGNWVDGLQSPFIKKETSFGSSKSNSSAAGGTHHMKDMLGPKLALEAISFKGTGDEKLPFYGPPFVGNEETRGRMSHIGPLPCSMMLVKEGEAAREDLSKYNDFHKATQGLSTSSGRAVEELPTSHTYCDRIGTIPKPNSLGNPFLFSRSFPEASLQTSKSVVGGLPTFSPEPEWNFSSLQLRFAKGGISTQLKDPFEPLQFPKLQNFQYKLPHMIQEFHTSLGYGSSDIPMNISESRDTTLSQHIGPSDVRGIFQSVTSLNLDKRKPRVGPSTFPSGSVNIKEASNKPSVSSNLPHWLREAFKGPMPPQPALPPNIAAIAQAVDLAFKDSTSLLPNWTNPGPPPMPPHRRLKKRKKKKKQQQHQQEQQRGLKIGCGVAGDRFPGYLGNALFSDMALMGRQSQSSYFPGLGLKPDSIFPSMEPPLTSTLLNVPPSTQFQWTIGDRMEQDRLPASSLLAHKLNTGNQTVLPGSSGEALHNSLKPPVLNFGQFVPASQAFNSIATRTDDALHPLDQHWQSMTAGTRECVSHSKVQQTEHSQQTSILASSNGQEHCKVLVGATDSEDSSSKTHSDPCIRVNAVEESNNDDASSEQTISDDRSSRHEL